jgi:hypothetical protein
VGLPGYGEAGSGRAGHHPNLAVAAVAVQGSLAAANVRGGGRLREGRGAGREKGGAGRLRPRP